MPPELGRCRLTQAGAGLHRHCKAAFCPQTAPRNDLRSARPHTPASHSNLYLLIKAGAAQLPIALAMSPPSTPGDGHVADLRLQCSLACGRAWTDGASWTRSAVSIPPVYNLKGGGPGTAQGRLPGYLEWATTTVQRVGSQISAADLDQLVLTAATTACCPSPGR